MKYRNCEDVLLKVSHVYLFDWLKIHVITTKRAALHCQSQIPLKLVESTEWWLADPFFQVGPAYQSRLWKLLLMRLVAGPL